VFDYNFIFDYEIILLARFVVDLDSKFNLYIFLAILIALLLVICIIIQLLIIKKILRLDRHSSSISYENKIEEVMLQSQENRPKYSEKKDISKKLKENDKLESFIQIESILFLDKFYPEIIKKIQSKEHILDYTKRVGKAKESSEAFDADEFSVKKNGDVISIKGEDEPLYVNTTESDIETSVVKGNFLNVSIQPEIGTPVVKEELLNIKEDTEGELLTVKEILSDVSLESETQNLTMQNEALNVKEELSDMSIIPEIQNLTVHTELLGTKEHPEIELLIENKENSDLHVQPETENLTIQNETLNVKEELSDMSIIPEIQNLAVHTELLNIEEHPEIELLVENEENSDIHMKPETENLIIQNEVLDINEHADVESLIMSEELSNVSVIPEIQNSAIRHEVLNPKNTSETDHIEIQPAFVDVSRKVNIEALKAKKSILESKETTIIKNADHVVTGGEIKSSVMENLQLKSTESILKQRLDQDNFDDYSHLLIKPITLNFKDNDKKKALILPPESVLDYNVKEPHKQVIAGDDKLYNLNNVAITNQVSRANQSHLSFENYDKISFNKESNKKDEMSSNAKTVNDVNNVEDASKKIKNLDVNKNLDFKKIQDTYQRMADMYK